MPRDDGYGFGDGGFIPFVEDAPAGGHPIFLALTDEMKALHQLKSGGYGRDTDAFANFTAVAQITGRQRCEYPVERIIEKVTRFRSLVDQGRWDEVGEELLDIAGLSLCAEAMRREDAGTPDGDPRHPKIA